jgi:hypothetical protein
MGEGASGAGGRGPLTGGSGRPSLTVEDLVRWEDNGATWRAFELSDTHALVELCTCTGEPVDMLRGDSVELVAYVRATLDATSHARDRREPR